MTPSLGPRIQERARESGTTLVESSAELARASDILFSTVTSSSALDAARQTAPFLDAASRLRRSQFGVAGAEAGRSAR